MIIIVSHSVLLRTEVTLHRIKTTSANVVKHIFEHAVDVDNFQWIRRLFLLERNFTHEMSCLTTHIDHKTSLIIAKLPLIDGTIWHLSWVGDTHHEKDNTVLMLPRWHTFRILHFKIVYNLFCVYVTSRAHSFALADAWDEWLCQKGASQSVDHSTSVFVYVISYTLYVSNQVFKMSPASCFCARSDSVGQGVMLALSLLSHRCILCLWTTLHAAFEKTCCALLHGVFVMWCNLNVCSYHIL